MSFNVIRFPGGRPVRPAAKERTPSRDLWHSLSGDLIERYLDARYIDGGLTRAGQQAFRDDLRGFDRWMQHAFGRTLVTAQADDVSRYFNACAASSLSTRSILRALSSIRGFYGFLRDGGIRSDDPVQQMLDSLRTSNRPLLASGALT